MHLPDAVVKIISTHVQRQSDKQAAMVSLMSMCGVSQQWRDVARHLDEGVLHFDALQTCGRNTLGRPLTPVELKFRGSSAHAKKAFFHSAAKLFTGYTEVVLSGEGITDVTLLEAARAAGEGLLSVVVKDTSTVTDAGLSSLALFTSRLTSLRLVNLPRVRGTFIAGLLERCPRLEVLHLETLPSCWEGQGFSSPSASRAKALRKLSVLGCKVDISAAALLAKIPELRSFSYDGPPTLMRVATTFCPKLEEVCYSSTCQEALNETIRCLLSARNLRTLEMTPRGMMLLPEQLHTMGRLPLTELRLNSFMYNQQPAINRASQSHLDNDGVRALVDSICHRVSARPGAEPQPFRLSLCGATALTHDAVSALLRLPLLSELKIDGCFRINSMDKMRLVAKVKAGASKGGSAATSLCGGGGSSGGSAGSARELPRAFSPHLHRMLRSVA